VPSIPINLRQSGPTPVELLISTRIRKSPYWHLSVEAGCWRAEVYNRVYHPGGYGRNEDGGAMVEYGALVNRVTMWVDGRDPRAVVREVLAIDHRIAQHCCPSLVDERNVLGVNSSRIDSRLAQPQPSPARNTDPRVCL
jgi:hypothetical protein